MRLRPGPLILALGAAIGVIALAALGDLGAMMLRPLAPHIAWLFP